MQANPEKFGIAFLCVSTGSPGSDEYIANCTALDKMKECLGTKLGYLTFDVGTNITTSQLDSIISQVETLKLPPSYQRVIFYFFGHGNDESVKLADGCFPRQHIISKFQLICPPESDVFKIFIFDSCRMVSGTTCEAVQESNEQRALTGGEAWKTRGQYPESTNTLVINATDFDSKAYYLVRNGCGLMTQFFTELAPTRNESFRDLLAAVRKEIAEQTTAQILVYEDKLMGTVNLLAESQGIGKYNDTIDTGAISLPLYISICSARVIPTIEPVDPSILSTNVHWRFADNVQQKIKRFEVEVRSPEHCVPMVTGDPRDRMATISGLNSDTTYTVQLSAVYNDDIVAKSDIASFQTPGTNCITCACTCR